MRSSTQSLSLEANKAATARVGPPTAPVDEIPPDTTRSLAPDLTGLYEAISDDPAMNSCRLLQLNQVGQALVGWFSRPPSFVQPMAQGLGVSEAVLLAELAPAYKQSKGWRFYYIEADGQAPDARLVDMDPTAVLSPSSPWDEGDRPDNVHVGYLLGSADGVTITLTKGPDELVVVDSMRFVLLATARRLSNRAIKAQSVSARRMYRLHHQQYIPSSYFALTEDSGRDWQRALSLFDSNGPFADAIRAYAREQTSVVTSTANLLIAIDTMRAALHFPWDGTDYAPYMRVLLLNVANSTTLTIDGVSRTFAGWLAQIGVWESSTDGLAYPVEFSKIVAERVYRYTFEFDANVNLSAPWKGGLSGAVAAFSATITVSFGLRGSDGVVTSWSSPTPTDGPAQITCRGAFFEGDFGLGAPGLPKTVTFDAPGPLPSRDFEGAVFWIRSLKVAAGLEAKFSTPLGSMSLSTSVGAGSYWMTIFTKTTRLDASFDSFTPLDWSAKNSIDGKHLRLDPGTLKKFARGDLSPLYKIPQSFGDLVSKSLALGVGRGTLWTAAASNWNLPGAPQASDATMGTDAELQTAAGFAFDQDTLDREVNGWSVRFLLEIILATEVALFAGVANVVFAGYASPEGPADHNRLLSANRARAVQQAVEDALGQALAPEFVGSYGFGEDSSYAGNESADHPDGCADSKDPPVGDDLARWEEEHQDDVRRWPHWRRVDVLVRGKFALRVRTVDGLPVTG